MRKYKLDKLHMDDERIYNEKKIRLDVLEWKRSGRVLRYSNDKEKEWEYFLDYIEG